MPCAVTLNFKEPEQHSKESTWMNMGMTPFAHKEFFGQIGVPRYIQEKSSSLLSGGGGGESLHFKGVEILVISLRSR